MSFLSDYFYSLYSSLNVILSVVKTFNINALCVSYCLFIMIVAFYKVKTGKREGRDPPGPMALYIHVELHARGFSFWVYI